MRKKRKWIRKRNLNCHRETASRKGLNKRQKRNDERKKKLKQEKSGGEEKGNKDLHF